MNQIGALCQIDHIFRPKIDIFMIFEEFFLRTFGVVVLFFILVGCATAGNEKEVSKSVSKYGSKLPAMGFEPVGRTEENLGLQDDSVYSDSVDGVVEIQETGVPKHEPTAQLDITPVIFLAQSYTLQLGLFEQFNDAKAFVLTHKLVPEDAGIAEVSINGTHKFLLAYGVYADESQARQAAQQLSKRLDAADVSNDPVQVRTLAEVESLASAAENRN